MIALAALARAGRWDEAGQKIRELGAARDSAPELSFVGAVSRRLAGDADAMRSACSDLLARHGTTQNPDRALWIVKTCLLHPDALSGPARVTVATLIGQTIDLPTFGTRDSLGGALAVRSERFPAAIELLTRAVAAGEKTPHTMLFLALAFARTHRVSEAATWLSESEKFIWPAAGMFSRKVFRDAWFDAEAEILRDEVSQILNGPVAPTRAVK
jgi:hypothetical protein